MTPSQPIVLDEEVHPAATEEGILPVILSAVEAFHRTLLTSVKPASHYALQTQSENWSSRPALFRIVSTNLFSEGKPTLLAVIPWVTTSGEDIGEHLRAVKASFGPAAQGPGYRVCVVTEQAIEEKELISLAKKAGGPVCGLNAVDRTFYGSNATPLKLYTLRVQSADNNSLDVPQRIEEDNTLNREKATFETNLIAATPRVWVTPMMVVLCVVVFLLMVASDLGALMSPSIDHLMKWGALFAPNVKHGEQWRLITAMFVHIGLFHIAVNMVCFWPTGRMAERLFGNVPFLVIYLLSGLGGTIASMTFNGNLVSAGASGAIFGVFGATLGFLATRRRVIPAATLRPLARSTILFVGYNLVATMGQSQIDSAAHIGGLVTGFLCGALLSRPIPAPQRAWVRQTAFSVVAAVGLLIAASTAISRVPEDAMVWQPGVQELSDAYNAMITGLRPQLEEYDKIQAEFQRLADSKIDDSEAGPAMRALGKRARKNHKKAAGQKHADPRVGALAAILVEGMDEQALAMETFGNAPVLDEKVSQEFIEHLQASQAAIARFEQERDALMKANGVPLIKNDE